jgi:hypothetical protein
MHGNLTWPMLENRMGQKMPNVVETTKLLE